MPQQADIIIIGAGVVGLAVAAKIAKYNRTVFVLERNHTFGLEISSRHSGVIHSGIYYPPGSLKARLCVAGNHRLYQLGARFSIGHRQLGKLIVATSSTEVAELEALLERGRDNGVEGLRILSRGEIRGLEPHITGVAAILSPSTGIIDSAALMQYWSNCARKQGAQIVYKCRVVGIDRVVNGYRVSVEDGSGIFSFTTTVVINCAGLGSDKIAEIAGIDIDLSGYRLHYCKGEYFSVSSRKSRLVSRLVYPLPPKNLTGVGVHVGFDLDGRMRLGPSTQYVTDIDYTVNRQHQPLFYDSAKKLLPFLEYDDLEPEMAGIRPKLQKPGEGIRDFIIREESDKGLPGLINLIGIESPGLTASPAIADYVSALVDAYF